MEHGTMLAIGTVGVVVVLWSTFGSWLARRNISAPMVFVAAGLVAANGPAAWLHVDLGSETLALLAEVVLAVVLFADASGLRRDEVAGDAGVLARLLGFGLPLTIALGAAVTHLLLPDLSWAQAALVAAAVAPSDAALGAAIVEDERVPARLRRVLNVESGLNDGIATPFVNVFILLAASAAGLHHESTGHAILGLLGGLAAGAVLGRLGGKLLRAAVDRGWTTTASAAIAQVGLALGTYCLVVVAGGNGFVAAFVAGLAFGPSRRKAVEEVAHEAEHGGLAHDASAVGAWVVWFLFGAVLLPEVRHATVATVAVAVLALTLVRMGPVRLVLLGTDVSRRDALLVGWFGPRGLASVVFALLAYDDLGPAVGGPVAVTVALTVALSVVAHGVSASPLAARAAQPD